MEWNNYSAIQYLRYAPKRTVTSEVRCTPNQLTNEVETNPWSMMSKAETMNDAMKLAGMMIIGWIFLHQ